jgi:glycosyltransferase involved in cell wall biosynthesis
MFKEIEIIIVDDCSTDESMKIINEFATNDNRIKVIEMPKNSGVSTARNAGLKAAKGEFIMFLDSDDCLFANAAVSMLSVASANRAELVVGRYSYVNDDFAWNPAVAMGSIGGHGMTFTKDITEFIKMIDFGITPVTCWGKLFRREVLGDLQFSADIYPNEDLDFMLRAYFKFTGHTAVLSDAPVVFYRRSKNSIILAGLNNKFIEGWQKAVLSVNKYLPADGKYRRFFGGYVLAMLRSMLGQPSVDESLCSAVRNIYMAGVFANADISKRVRFGLKLYVLGFKRLSRYFFR